jgi:hypothetical protein
MTISISTEGRRCYITGNTYPFRDRIRALGAHWDATRKQWWTGKREEAEQLVAKLQSDEQAARQQEREQGISTSACVIRGRAEYQGKVYYLLAHGVTKEGKPYVKLCFRDGSKVFWAANVAEVKILREYDDPCSIDSLRQYAAAKAKARKERKERGDDQSYRSPDGNYMITRDGRHLVRYWGPHGSYWTTASAQDEFDEFDS